MNEDLNGVLNGRIACRPTKPANHSSDELAHVKEPPAHFRCPGWVATFYVGRRFRKTPASAGKSSLETPGDFEFLGDPRLSGEVGDRNPLNRMFCNTPGLAGKASRSAGSVVGVFVL